MHSTNKVHKFQDNCAESNLSTQQICSRAWTSHKDCNIDT